MSARAVTIQAGSAMEPLMRFPEIVLFVAIGYIALALVVGGRFWWDYWFLWTPEQRDEFRRNAHDPDNHESYW